MTKFETKQHIIKVLRSINDIDITNSKLYPPEFHMMDTLVEGETMTANEFMKGSFTRDLFELIKHHLTKEPTELKVVVIKRSEWGQFCLLNPDNGKKCCLGFTVEAYGIPKEFFKNKSYPWSISNSCEIKNELPSWLLDPYPHGDAAKASEINDRFEISNKEKEESLKPIFLKYGIDLQFID